jgi:hypothetical protein
VERVVGVQDVQGGELAATGRAARNPRSVGVGVGVGVSEVERGAWSVERGAVQQCSSAAVYHNNSNNNKRRK